MMRTRAIALVVVLHIVIFGALIADSRGLPYVLDNNESFSALVHASNLYRFGVSKSKGITDEAYGPDPDAHPYVYTHQGNFPRLASLVIYAAGARTIESQILVSTLTIGLFGTLIAFAVFHRLMGTTYAVLASIVMLTDYVLSVQWTANTFKVWHGVLFFLSLRCALGLRDNKSHGWVFATVATFACLFYFDLMLAAFTGAAATTFAILVNSQNRIAQSVRFCALAGTGAILAIGALVGQLVSYYGWTTFKQDFYLTFIARNASNAATVDRRVFEEFFAEHRIVFWFDFGDGAQLRSVAPLVKQLFTYGFGVYTPHFALAVTVLAIGWLIGELRPTLERGLHRFPVRVIDRLGLPVLAGGALAVATAIFRDIRRQSAIVPIEPSFPAEPVVVMVGLVGLAILVGALILYLYRNAPQILGLPAGDVSTRHSRSLIAGIFLVVCAVFVWNWPRFFVAPHTALWGAIFQPLGNRYVIGATTLAICVLSIAPSLAPRHGSAQAGLKSAGIGIAPYFAGTLAGFLVAYAAFPGYASANMQRYTPMLVFLIAPAVALAAHALARLAVLLGANGGGLLSRAAGAAALPTLLLGCLVWAKLQWTYLQLLPPDSGAVYQRLTAPQYRDQSFVSGNYAAPVAVMTNQWALHDLTFISRGEYTLDPNGYRIRGAGSRGESLFLWFADRDNPRYRNPRFALCAIQPNFQDSLRRIELLSAAHLPVSQSRKLDNPDIPTANRIGHAFGLRTGCRMHEVPFRAESGAKDGFPLKLLERDPSPLHRWSIVELTREFPPYLKPLNGLSNARAAYVEARSDGTAVTVTYAYSDQGGVSESGSRILADYRREGGDEVRLYDAESGGKIVVDHLPRDAMLRVTVIPRNSNGLEGVPRHSHWIPVAGSSTP